MMPDVNLMQTEWVRHGSCAFAVPEEYFTRIQALWQALEKPSAESITRGRSSLVAGDIVEAFVRQNHRGGLRPEHLRVRVGKGQYLREIIVCYDKAFRYTPCRLSGTPPHQKIRIR